MVTNTDRIEKTVVVKAPLARVWRAISNAKEFGTWFGFTFDRDFAPGRKMQGTIVPTQVDEEIAKAQESHAGLRFEFEIERIEPMRVFSYRWHPFAIDPNVDYSSEPTTLVTFELAEVGDGTQVKIVETGFDALPLARRTDAFEANDGGWDAQTMLLEKYVTRASG